MVKRSKIRFLFIYNTLSIIILIVLFSIINYFVLDFEQKRIDNELDSRFVSHLNDLSNYIELYARKKNISSLSLKDTAIVNENKADFNKLNEIISQKRYFNNSFPFVVDINGNYIIHPFQKNKNINSSYLFEQILLKKNGKIIISNDNTPQHKETIVYFKYDDLLNSYIAIQINKKDAYVALSQLEKTLLLAFLFSLLILIIFNSYIINLFIRFLTGISKSLQLLAKGKVVENLEETGYKEVLNLVNPLNTLIRGLQNTTAFANEISQGNINADFVPLSENDVLGNSLLNMRKSLVIAKTDEDRRKKEDAQRNWTSEGLAKFAELLRENNDNIEELSNTLIKNVVEYLKANQGGMFLYNDENPSDVHIELISAYAYNRKKYLKKKFELGEGLVGNCALEKQTVFLTDIPENYIEITSGLGGANPRSLIIVPMKIEESIFGIIELASFKVFEQYEIDFVEKIASSIATTIANLKINIHTAKLLKETQEQAKKMAEQEEEMRQNMEELQATQEEAAKQSELLASFTNSVNHTLIRAEYKTDGTLLYANTKFLSKLGYLSSKEVIGQHISMFINDKDREWFFKIWDGLSKGGKHFEGDMKHVTKQGKDLWTMATYTCVRDNSGNVEKILFLAIDTTEQKKQSLDYEGQIQALNNSTLKAELEPSGKIILSNKQFLSCFDFEAEDEIKNKTIFEFISKDDIDEFKRIWKNTIAGNPYQGQGLRITNLGEKKWLNETCTAVCDMYGDVAKIIYIANDITEQKKMEQETMRQSVELQSKEKELLQNIEELQVLQEEMKKNQFKLEESEKKLKKQLDVIETEKKKNALILEGCVEGILTFNQDGIIELINVAAESIIGCNKEQLIGNHINTIFDIRLQREKDKLVAYYQNGVLKKLNNIKTEVSIRKFSGELSPVLLTLNEIESHTNITFAAFIQNIEVELF